MRVPLQIDLPLGTALRVLADTQRSFALVGQWAGGGALLGCDPVRVAPDDGDPFELLGGAEPVGAGVGGDSVPRVGTGPGAGAGPGGWVGGSGAEPGLAVGGGWVGYIGYPARALVERGQPSPPRSVPLPAASLCYYDSLVRLDRDGRWWFEALPTTGSRDALEQRLAWWTERLTNLPPARSCTTDGWRLVPSAGAHAELVAACRERIRAGDLFQANICAQLVGRIEGEPLELFIQGVEALAPDWGAYLSSPRGTVVSLSPELFLQRRGREVRSAPIKGTRPRPADPAAAAAQRTALAQSEKDRAENVMIVDLIRNDLGRVCEPGTIVAEPVAEVQAHAGVWHLVSEVRGTLRGDVSDGRLLRATFPPGSVTGAPKIAAMDVIAELESTEREVYTGAIGIGSPVSGLELNVAIRTFEVTGSSIRLGVGGGVVADSDPHEEAVELATKAAPLLEAVGAPAPALSDVDGHFIAVRRFGPFPVPRPDPRRGVFEALLVEDRQVVRLEAHLDRLGSSLGELYGLELPATTGDRIVASAAATEGRRRMRIDVVCDPPWGMGYADAAAERAEVERADARWTEGSLELGISLSPFVRRPPVGLRACTVPGGLGAHKWIDRTLIDAMESACGDELPLLVDADGYVLEASRASVFALVAGGVLRTPPDDGRILPGVARACVLEHAEAAGLPVSTAPLPYGELSQARAVVLTSALRQTPALALDGRELGREPALLALIEAALAGNR